MDNAEGKKQEQNKVRKSVTNPDGGSINSQGSYLYKVSNDWS